MTCAVRSCYSSYRNLKDKPNGLVSFHRFPSDPHLKSKWLENIGRADWLPTKDARVCSLHFEKACYKNETQKNFLTIYAVPTIFENQPANVQQETYDTRSQVPRSMRTLSSTISEPTKFSSHSQAPKKPNKKKQRHANTNKSTFKKHAAASSLKHQKTDSSEELEYTDDSDDNRDLSPHMIDPAQNTENTELSKKRQALNAQALTITLARIQENPQLYIGIPKNCYHIVDLLHKQTKIPTTHILLCLKKVKLDTHFEELADQFGIPSEEAKGIFVENIPVIAQTLQSFIANLNSKNIKSNLLIPFRSHQNTTIVIDTLELKVQPTTAQSKELTQSENGNTIKYLISCCPDGFVDYVSPGYGGKQTDENLLESTGYLERFDQGTCIITKRFKNAEPMLLRKGMKLLRPRSYTKQSSTSADQYAPCKRILDHHIERVVQRVREFTMIKDNTAISSDLVRVLDEAVVISCALVNLQSFVIN